MTKLNLIVLVKQVPDIEKVKFDAEKGRIDRSSATAETNPFDLNALEAAAQIKEKLGGKITAVSMGPLQAKSMLRDALARGADRAVLLTDKKFGGADTLATSYTLACAIKKIGHFDLIVCGEKTVDGDTGQVGPELAEHLDIPQATYVFEVKEVSNEKIMVLSDVEGEYYLIELRFPALITVTKDVNHPRLPSLRDKLKARRAEIETWSADDLAEVADASRFGISGSPTNVSKITFPCEEVRMGKIFRDAPEKAVGMFLEALLRDGVI
jgi:electron transfer flavoprotein beta subunit